MSARPQPSEQLPIRYARSNSQWRYMWKYKALYLISIPGILFFLVFKYVPLAGSVIAFQDYNMFKGFMGSPWVGFKHFQTMFEQPDFLRILTNTVLIGLYDLIIAFPLPIILALLLNELRLVIFKRFVQTFVYMPHFLSWVVIAGMSVAILSPKTGILNALLGLFGIDPIYFLGDNSYVRSLLVGTGIWRDSGYSMIVYLAALAGINPELYEASQIDGASRWKMTLRITLPALLPTITVLFLLHIGKFLDFGFERVWVFLNALNTDNGEILDTYIYRVGLLSQQFSYTTAVGMFKSVVGFVLVVLGNYFSRKSTGESLY